MLDSGIEDVLGAGRLRIFQELSIKVGDGHSVLPVIVYAWM